LAVPEFDGQQLLLGGLGVVHVPDDAYVWESLAAQRRRNVFHTSAAARIRTYYE